jgi:mRNA interferase RelE/StbE
VGKAEVRESQLHYHRLVVEQDLPSLDPPVRKRIQAAIENRLVVQPERYSQRLRHSLSGLRKLRVGDWRVLFTLEKSEIWILWIGHRKDLYQVALRSIRLAPKQN